MMSCVPNLGAFSFFLFENVIPIEIVLFLLRSPYAFPSSPSPFPFPLPFFSLSFPLS